MDYQEIKQLNAVRPYAFETEAEEQWYEVGLAEGVAAAEEHFHANSVWHQGSEEPEVGKQVVMVHYGSVYKGGTYIGKGFIRPSYEEKFTLMSDCTWAYVDDLMKL